MTAGDREMPLVCLNDSGKSTEHTPVVRGVNSGAQRQQVQKAIAPASVNCSTIASNARPPINKTNVSILVRASQSSASGW